MAAASIIIPARWGSSRFEGKPLTATLTAPDGTAQPLVYWSYRAALRALPAEKVWLATDDVRIAEAGAAFGAQIAMTAASCRNGTERTAEAAAQLNLPRDEIIVNLQGDAPLTPPDFVAALIDALSKDPTLMVATPALRCDAEALHRLRDQRSRGLVGGTTLVKARDGRAMYFSKEVLPCAEQINPASSPLPVFHHVGLYAYRRTALERYLALPQGTLERIEGLEQLRFLEHSIPVHCVEVDTKGRGFWEVNNPEDVELVGKYL